MPGLSQLIWLARLVPPSSLNTPRVSLPKLHPQSKQMIIHQYRRTTSAVRIHKQL